MVDNTYTKKKKKKNNYIMPDVKGSIDSFNHAVEGTGSIPGTGMAISEEMEDDIKVSDDIFKAILNEFPSTDFSEKGASFILPSGKFLNPDKAHGEVDEFIVSQFPEIDLTDYPNGYLVDNEQCVRLNDGRGKSFTFDRYITLPKYITLAQIYSIEDWLKDYPYEEITIADTFGHMAEFNLEKDGIDYIMNRIKKYKNTQILSEELNEGEILIDSENELPDVAENNIIKDEDAGISSMFIDMINECWTIIDHYHSMIVTLDSLNRHEFDETLQGLLEEHNKEVGALQGILELLSPASSQIEQGKEEAQDQISFDKVEESYKGSIRKQYSELLNPVKRLLKEEFISNGSLEDFNPSDLVEKAFNNKCSTNSIRKFKDKLLYINVDPGFIFGVRSGSDKIWIDVIEIDSDNNQDRIYLDSALTKEDAIDLLNNWILEYTNNEIVPNEGEDINGEE